MLIDLNNLPIASDCLWKKKRAGLAKALLCHFSCFSVYSSLSGGKYSPEIDVHYFHACFIGFLPIYVFMNNVENCLAF